MAETTTTTYLGRCRDCDYALFASADSIEQADNAVAGGPAVNVGNGQIMGRCTSGHRWFGLKRVKGTYSEGHKCDSRCLNAKGHDCTCQCGGLNHGRGYAVAAVQVPAEKAALAAEVPGYHPAAVPVKLPEPGATIRSEVRCTRVAHNVGEYNATLFTFITETGKTLKWFAPDYLSNAFEADEAAMIRAKVKRTSEWNGRIETIVTHVEKIEE